MIQLNSWSNLSKVDISSLGIPKLGRLPTTRGHHMNEKYFGGSRPSLYFWHRYLFLLQGFKLCTLDYDFHILDNAFLIHRYSYRSCGKQFSFWKKNTVLNLEKKAYQISDKYILILLLQTWYQNRDGSFSWHKKDHCAK